MEFIENSTEKEVWNFIFRSFGISWVLPETVADLLFGWHNWLGKASSKVWNLVPHCLMWTIWRERNCRTFEDLDNPLEKIIELFTGSLFDWSRAWGFSLTQSLGTFLESLAFSHLAHSFHHCNYLILCVHALCTQSFHQ
jgi:hypothetical protein